MAFVKHEGTINTMSEFLVEIKKYLLQSGMFNNAVDFNTLPKVVFDGADIGFSIKHKEGKWFNFGIKRNYASVGNILSISISRDGNASRLFYDRFDTMMSESYPAATECGKYLFPFVNLYITTTKTFVAFSAEVKKGQFVHFIVGRHPSYDNGISTIGRDIGGEFIYITFMPDGTNPTYDKQSIGPFSNSYGSNSNMSRPERYLRCRTVLYDGIPARAWLSGTPMPSCVVYYGLSCPINIPLKEGLIEMYDIENTNILYGSSKYNNRELMNPHRLTLSVADKAVEEAAKLIDGDVAKAVVKDAEVFYNNEMCTLSIENIEPVTIMGDWVVFPLVTKRKDGIFEHLWSSHVGVGFKFK